MCPSDLALEEIEFLAIVRRREGTGDPVQPLLPVRPRIQSLIDRGWLRTCKLIGLGVWEEDRGLVTTDRAREYLLTTAEENQ